MTIKREDLPAAVRRVDEQFERWRAGKRATEQIPTRLWQAAVDLCRTYSVHRVSRWLHLNHTALHRRAGRRAGRPPSRPTFVEWSLPGGIVPGAVAEYVVEVKGRAPRIHVRGASALEVAALVKALGNSAGRA